MKIILEVDDAEHKSVIKKISKFEETNQTRQTHGKIIVLLKEPIPYENKSKIREIANLYNVKGVKTVIVSPVKAEKGSTEIKIRNKRCHCFFDIDSTLTRGDGTINGKVRKIFAKMKDAGFRIYFVSGRNTPQVRQDMIDFATEPYGIAENGGVILGFGENNEFLFGDRTEPDKALSYLLENCKKVKEDIKQGLRKTEVIIINNTDEKRIMQYIKKSTAMVDCNASKTSYHISERGKHKGSAVEKFISEMRLKPGELDMIIAAGDSDIDAPMLNIATYSFAVGNASDKALENSDIWLEKESVEGIEEFYDKLKELL